MSFPLFKGATRSPTIGGVPIIPLLIMCITIASCAMLFSLKLWLLIIPAWFIMRQITLNDDKAFRIWWLWLDTKGKNSNKFWGASTYSKNDFRLQSRR